MDRDQTAAVIWLMGLSGAGKTTLCHSLDQQIRDRGLPVQILDADEFRRHLCQDLSFTQADRHTNVARMAYVANLLARNRVNVLVAAITPLHSMRQFLRSFLDRYVEVFVDAPLSICEERDPKGLYRRARALEITSFTGIDSPFEAPLSSDVICHTDRETLEESTAKILEACADRLVPRLFPVVSQNTRGPSIAVDFDGVIANYEGWAGEAVLGSPRADVIAALRVLRSEGWKIIVHTTRSGEDIGGYLQAANVPFDEINRNSEYSNRGPKPVATVYWDDRAICYTGDAQTDLKRILQFMTWSGRR